MKSCVQCNFSLSIDAVFCSDCGVKQPDSSVCIKCSYPNETNSKFCQECGLSLFDTIKPKVETAFDGIPQIPSTGIVVQFPFSTAASYEFAVAEARKISSFAQYGEGKKAVFRVNVDSDNVIDLVPLLEQLKGWRRRYVYVDGEKSTWDSVFGFLWCFEAKNSSFRPEKYCYGFENEWETNLWGCMRANLPFREGAKWLTWGKWISNRGDWEFDKRRIRHELEKNLFPFRHCPALNFQRIEAIISAIPNTVNPIDNSDWKFVERYFGDVQSPAIKMISTRWGEPEDVWVVGVEPNGSGALRDIARRAGLQLTF